MIRMLEKERFSLVKELTVYPPIVENWVQDLKELPS
jgi:hypothetical protein